MKKILFFLPFLTISTLVGCSEPKMSFKEDNEAYIYQDYKYGPAENRRNLMDVVIPKEKSTNSGLILYIHGGGWTAGDKTTNLEDSKKWIRKGHVFAAINYRYAAEKVHNEDMMSDVTLSLSKIKELANQYDIDLQKAILFGGSAGAHMSLYYSYVKKDIAPIKPVACMSLSGPTDLLDDYYFKKDGKNTESYMKIFTKLTGASITVDSKEERIDDLKAVSPLHQINDKSDTVPTIIAHGELDDVVPLSNAAALKSKLDEVGQVNDYYQLPHSGHGLESDPDIYQQVMNKFEEYIDTYLGGI